MSRSLSELRQAAKDAGWDGDPLATEILTALESLDVPQPNPPPVVIQAKSSRLVVGGSIGLAILSLAVAGFAIADASKSRGQIASERAAAAEEVAREKAQANADVAARNDEIAKLKADNAAQLQSVAERLASLIPVSESAAKNNAAAADSNTAAVKLYMTQFQSMIDEMKKARETSPPAAGVKDPVKP